MSTKTIVKKKREGGGEPMFDLEQQFIMRLPPGPAMALKQELNSGSLHLKDRLSIELQPDLKRGAIRYGNDYFSAKMMDLPSIIECHKTVDMKTFYKTADVSQMLITTTEEDAQDENESPKKKDKDKRFLWNHGITPPLKNVRKRRFRKTLKKKYMEQPDIEKEVKRLFRTDAEAISVSWELITEDEKPTGEGGEGDTIVAGTSGGFTRTDTAASLDIDIFGELSTSEEEEEKDINVMDSEDDESRQQHFLSMNSGLSTPQFMAMDNSNMSQSQTGADRFIGLEGDNSLSQSQTAQDSFIGIGMETEDQDNLQSQFKAMEEPIGGLSRSMKEEDSELDLMGT